MKLREILPAALSAVLCSSAALLGPTLRAQDTPAPAPSSPQAAISRYCVTCHNDKLKTGGVVLQGLDPEHPAQNAKVWEAVVRKLNARAMPPVGVPRPDEATYNSLVAYLTTELDRGAATAPNPGRTAAAHRLSRTEYANVVRDLLGVEIDAAALLPADDTSHGFDNNGDVLSVSPLLLEKYMAVARRISTQAVGDADVKTYTATYDVPRRLTQEDRMSEDLPFGSRGGLAARHTFPVDGEYAIKVRLMRNNDNYIRGLGDRHQLDVRMDGKRLKLFAIGGEPKGRSGPVYAFINKDYKGDAEQENYEFTADYGVEVRFPATAGTHTITAAFLDQSTEAEGELFPRHNFDELYSYKGGDPAVDYVAVTGPFGTKGLGVSESRQRIFTCSPEKAAGGKRTSANDCARQILSALARRAYRRPVSDADLKPLLQHYALGAKMGGFEEGVRTAIQGLLVSPEFLYRVELNPAGAKPGTVYRSGDFALASRLSFFIWSSIPDDELLNLAEKGQLSDPSTVEAQARRMLADPRSKALVDNFTSQWLGLKRLATFSPDPLAFPDFDDNLRRALSQETIMLAEAIARDDRSVIDFLNADYTFVNERLARHYGISNIYGSDFRRVALKDGTRGGLLGQGSVLTVTSYENRTSPTLRGKWVLENIMGSPPPPPPPDVPALKEESATSAKQRSMRERLEQHRVNPACSSCHARMDPLGFALDNYDAIGRWRTAEGVTPVNASGAMPTGEKFNGAGELKKILLQRSDLFVAAYTEKLMMYALGRGTEYYDQPALRQILREAKPDNYKWSALVMGVVRSEPFQSRIVR
jgi:mono/diheme cytochrome c family protein